jgi:integrase
VSAKLRVPSLRHHKPSGQAVTTLGGKDVYLGIYGTQEATQKYEQAISEWLARGRMAPATKTESDAGLTVAEILLPYLKHCDLYYRRADGTPTGEAANMKLALRPLRELYAHLPARDFGPLQLKAVRQRFIASTYRGKPLCRTDVNRRIQMVVRAFKWASVWHGLKCVEGLKRGRSEARETDPVRPVPIEYVDATLPCLAKPVAAMVRLQLLSGARPGEVCSLRACDLDMSGTVWVYRLHRHKTEHHGRSRKITFGPQAQEIIRSFLKPSMEAPLFSPIDAMEEWKERRRAENEAKRARCATKLYPSQIRRIESKRKKRRAKPYRDHYDVDSYRRAIKHAVAKANRERSKLGRPALPDWHPNQLRHTAGTKIRREFGLDAARAVLGHSTPIVTEIYAELDEDKAIEIMAKIG